VGSPNGKAILLDVKRLIAKAILFGIGLTILVQFFGVMMSATLEEIYFRNIEFGWLGSQAVNPRVVFWGPARRVMVLVQRLSLKELDLGREK
jgi:hypothetical protein